MQRGTSRQWKRSEREGDLEWGRESDKERERERERERDRCSLRRTIKHTRNLSFAPRYSYRNSPSISQLLGRTSKRETKSKKLIKLPRSLNRQHLENSCGKTIGAEHSFVVMDMIRHEIRMSHFVPAWPWRTKSAEKAISSIVLLTTASCISGIRKVREESKGGGGGGGSFVR